MSENSHGELSANIPSVPFSTPVSLEDSLRGRGRSVAVRRKGNANPMSVFRYILASPLTVSLAAQTSLSIVSAVVQNDLETPTLDRYRNEIASAITGIPPRRASDEGVLLLRHLLVLAPQPESDVAFLPSTRAVQVLQAIQKWISSDEEIDPVIESQTVGLLLHSAPIVQSLQGAHWEFAFNIIENTLEVSILTSEGTWSDDCP
jgi:E3 ubiquitin-protein ligase listerin